MARILRIVGRIRKKMGLFGADPFGREPDLFLIKSGEIMRDLFFRELLIQSCKAQAR